MTGLKRRINYDRDIKNNDVFNYYISQTIVNITKDYYLR